jgi:tetratricopeptide (TPR) repeat protein
LSRWIKPVPGQFYPWSNLKSTWDSLKFCFKLGKAFVLLILQLCNNRIMRFLLLTPGFLARCRDVKRAKINAELALANIPATSLLRPKAYAALGDALNQLGKVHAAVEAYHGALALNPGDASITDKLCSAVATSIVARSKELNASGFVSKRSSISAGAAEPTKDFATDGDFLHPLPIRRKSIVSKADFPEPDVHHKPSQREFRRCSVPELSPATYRLSPDNPFIDPNIDSPANRGHLFATWNESTPASNEVEAIPLTRSRARLAATLQHHEGRSWLTRRPAKETHTPSTVGGSPTTTSDGHVVMTRSRAAAAAAVTHGRNHVS